MYHVARELYGTVTKSNQFQNALITAQQQFVTKLKTSFFKDFLTLKTMEAFILACKIHEAVKIA